MSAQSAAPSEDRVALVIGNGKYHHVPPLDNPTNDARLVADTLVADGFHLVGDAVLLNADRAGMEHAIRDFGKRLRGGAIGLFFYAGHGVQIDGVNYLVPVAANVEDLADVKYELIDVNYVLDEMKNAGNRLNIVILDACRNNPFGGRGLRAITRGLAQMQAPAGTIISYATQPGNTAADGGGKDSPFTLALTDAMQKPGLGVFDTFNRVGLTVKSATGGQQQPWFDSSPIEGSFEFRAASLTATPPSNAAPGTAPSAAEDRAFWESVRDSKERAEFEAYLRRFPHGIYADLAKTRLERLSTPASAPAPRSSTAAPPPEAAEPAAATEASLTYPSAPTLHFGGALIESAQTLGNRVGSKVYAALPETADVKVYSATDEIKGRYVVVATLAHSDPCKWHHCTVENSYDPLSAKAREFGANGLIIDKSQTVQVGLVSRGISVQARAIRVEDP